MRRNKQVAEFEGKLNLNVETSEIEIKGTFKLSNEELDNVAGVPASLRNDISRPIMQPAMSSNIHICAPCTADSSIIVYL